MKPIVDYRPCENCHKEMPVIKYYEQKRFCSAKCRSMVIPMPDRPDQTGFIPWNKGLTQADDPRLKAISDNRRGEKNWQWKGGHSKSFKTAWSTSTYKNWRKAVFERDNYTCQMCGVRGGVLNADHIKCFAHHETLRYDINNGRTLCEPCHKTTPNFGYHKAEDCKELDKYDLWEQLEDYLKANA